LNKGLRFEAADGLFGDGHRGLTRLVQQMAFEAIEIAMGFEDGAIEERRK
jgi:hypothetical protein